MLCPYPRAKPLNQSGTPESFIVFPCGQCIFCRINKQRELEVRLELEYRSWDCSAWITLTYDEIDCPDDGQVTVTHIEKFRNKLKYELLKREALQQGIKVKEYIKERRGKPLCNTRIFVAPEYGKKRLRPHYHAIIFGLDGTDFRGYSKRLKTNDCRVLLQVQSELETAQDDWAIIYRSWTFGFIECGEVKPGGIRYVIKYATKGICHEKEDGVLESPPFIVRSPGLGDSGLDAIAAACTRKGIITGKTGVETEVQIPYSFRDRKSGVTKSGVRKLPLGRHLREKLGKLVGFEECYESHKKIHHAISTRKYFGQFPQEGNMKERRERVLEVNRRREQKTKL